MASRRIRIKDIANIPQRRKTAVTEEKQKDNETNSISIQKPILEEESECEKLETYSINKNNKNAEDKIIYEEEITAYVRKPEEVAVISELKQQDVSNLNLDTVKEKENSFISTKQQEKVLAESDEKQIEEANALELKEKEKVKTPTALDVYSGLGQNKPIFKGNFIKPIISSTVLQRRSKPKLEDESRTSGSESESSSTNKKEANEIKTHLEQFSVKETGNITHPPAPPSPSKINRGRIKVIPRFGQRRQSFSASESEDDNRKSNRIRNDSVCSTASEMVDQSYTVECPHSPKKDFANVVQRKFKRTEQSRKLAEARREFLQKFGTAKPDRQKLTMMDLIFYNPSGNPMSQKRKYKTTEDTTAEEDVVAAAVAEEETPISDEENQELPAPQIKVGPNGEITIDEKSLVIENKQIKRSQEKIQSSKLIDGDSDATYGIYTKVKRTKLWSKKETLRFYKALNAIGTDFSLMLSLFPGRTRRDLTMKFKKEEKINRTLIDRALMVPNTYDIAELKREMEMEVREERDKEKIKREVELLTKKKLEEKRKKKEEKQHIDPTPRKRSHTARKLYKDLNKGINSFLDDESDADDESDTSTRTITTAAILDTLQASVKKKSLRPRKLRKIYTDPEQSDEDEIQKQQMILTEKPVDKQESENTAEEKPSELQEEVEKNPNMEPGSVLMYSTTGADGSPVYKFFMVAPVQGEKINMQNKTILNIGTVRVEESVNVPTEENNITISAAQEEVTKSTPSCIIQQHIVIKPGTNTADNESVDSQ